MTIPVSGGAGFIGARHLCTSGGFSASESNRSACTLQLICGGRSGAIHCGLSLHPLQPSLKDHGVRANKTVPMFP